MIDSHAHLNFPEFAGKIDQIVLETKEAGLSGIIVASSNLADSFIATELTQKYSGYLFASVGIHPQKTDPENRLPIKDQLSQLENFIHENKSCIVAIGETGLDFSPAPPREESRSYQEQENLFLGQIELSKKYNLPLIIHARKAVDEVIKILISSCSTLRGVFHCYAGGKKRVQKILSLPGTWYFGFDGNITYDAGLTGIIPVIPEERILIETDSPFLTPKPFRGQRNTPAYLPYIQNKLNKILDKDLTSQILQNTHNLFNNLALLRPAKSAELRRASN